PRVSISIRPMSASLAYELLQRVARLGHKTSVAARRHDDFGQIDVPARIHPDPVRRVEVTRGTGVETAAPARPQAAVPVEDADPTPGGVGAGGGRPRPHARTKAQLGDEQVTSPVDENLARPGDVCPLG